MISVGGVDPGLVHTGVVVLHLDTEKREAEVEWSAVAAIPQPNGEIDVDMTATHVYGVLGVMRPDQVFIEKYEPRSHFDTDSRMSSLVREIHRAVGGKIISNTGSKQTIKPKLMELLHLNTFPTTHHQDLQAAARILVYGALKDDKLNEILYEFVEDHLGGRPWRFI